MKRISFVKSFIEIVLIFFTFSIFGWVWELLYDFLKNGVLANHGVLLGPWLPIYGYGAILMYICLKRFKQSPTIVFMGSFVLCTCIEYCTAWYLETFLHNTWWDYSNMPFNIDGRICLLASIFFGIGGLFAMYVVIPKIKKTMARFSLRRITILCIVLCCLFTVDKIRSYKYPNIGKRYKVIDTTQIRGLKIFKK